MNRRAVLLLLLCLVLEAGRGQILLGQDSRPPLILISFDGFRWDYRTKYSPPNMNRLAAKGVSADLIPSYPSKTFPNHYTIVTGPVSRTPWHRRQHRQRPADRASAVDGQQHRERRRDVVGRRANLGDGAARRVVVGVDVLGGLRGAHRRTPAELLVALQQLTIRECAGRSHTRLAGPSRRQAADAADALHQRRRWRRPQQWARVGGRAVRSAPCGRLPGSPAGRP